MKYIFFLFKSISRCKRKSLGKLFFRYKVWQKKRLVQNHIDISTTCDVHTNALDMKCLKIVYDEGVQNEKRIRTLWEYGEYFRMVEFGRDIWR